MYFYSAIDIKGKFILSLPYSALNSQNTLDFFKKVELVGQSYSGGMSKKSVTCTKS